jgi:energy-coupling factor transport system permease protein
MGAMKQKITLKKHWPHPSTQIIIWICLAIIVQMLQATLLAVATVGLLLVAFKLHDQRLFTLMRRARWIMFSLLLIYAFMTPGEALWSLPYAPSPTREGVLDGLMQLARLSCVLSALSILLTLLTREKLISGIYLLAFPARFIGVSRERIAVRLALTLHYAESAMRDTASDWRSAIAQALAVGKSHSADIELQVQPLARVDVLLLVLSGALLLGVWL